MQTKQQYEFTISSHGLHESPPEMDAIFQSMIKYDDFATALAELFDNSIEYGPTTTIDVSFGDNFIVVSDDGRGMDEDGIINMLQFKRQEHVKGATGKYGYGFKAATHYMAKETLVISKKDGIFYFGRHAPGEEWKSHVEKCESGHPDYKYIRGLWRKHHCRPRVKSGTLVYMRDIRQPLDKKVLKKIGEHFAITYAEQVTKAKLKLCVDGKEINYTRIKGAPTEDNYVRAKYNFKGHDFYVSILMAPEKKKNSDKLYNKGLIYRNERLIAYGQSIGVAYGNNPNYKRVQIVLELDENFDEYINMQPNKTLSGKSNLHPEFKKFLDENTEINKILRKICNVDKDSWEPPQFKDSFLKKLDRMAKGHGYDLNLGSGALLNKPLLKNRPPKPRKPRKPSAAPPKIKKVNSSINFEWCDLGEQGPLHDFEMKAEAGKSRIEIRLNKESAYLISMSELEDHSFLEGHIEHVIMPVALTLLLKDIDPGVFDAIQTLEEEVAKTREENHEFGKKPKFSAQHLADAIAAYRVCGTPYTPAQISEMVRKKFPQIWALKNAVNPNQIEREIGSRMHYRSSSKGKYMPALIPNYTVDKSSTPATVIFH